MISAFVVTDSSEPPSVDFDIEGAAPSSLRIHALEDEDLVLKGLRTYEYDLQFEVLPSELRLYLAECLRRVCDAGARLAWLAFEGSFDFRHVLSDDVADQIYGVCSTGCEPLVALDDQVLTSAEWRAKLKTLRERLL